MCNKNFKWTMKGLILFLLFACSSAEKTKKVDDLYGKVKTTKTYSYLASEENGNISSKVLVQYYVSDYNEKGQLLQKAHYDPEGELTYTWKYRYDANGNNVRVEGYFPFEYDITTLLQYNYDENGYQTERLFISVENGAIDTRWEFKNDASGNPIETLRWTANGALKDKRIVKYDKHGNMTEEQLFYPEKKKAVLHCKYTYEFDAQNNWTVMKSYRHDRGGELSELLIREIEYYDTDNTQNSGNDTFFDKYDEVSPIIDGIIFVSRNGKHGFLDSTGKEIVAPEYDAPFIFKRNLAQVHSNGKYGFIDRSGNKVIPLIYEFAHEFSEGLAAVRLHVDQYGYIDTTGKEVLPFEYRNASSFSEGLAVVTKFDLTIEFIDKKGNTAIPFQYDWADGFSDGLAIVSTDSKLKAIDKKGKKVLSLDEYDMVGRFSEGLLNVKKNEKWGFIDKTGKEVIPLIFDTPADFENGIAYVMQYGRILKIDKNGNEVITE